MGVNELSAEHWEAKAAQCRRLAARFTDPDTIRMLIERTMEFDAEAAAIRKKSRRRLMLKKGSSTGTVE